MNIVDMQRLVVSREHRFAISTIFNCVNDEFGFIYQLALVRCMKWLEEDYLTFWN